MVEDGFDLAQFDPVTQHLDLVICPPQVDILSTREATDAIAGAIETQPLRFAGLERDEAIRLGGQHRLRPILITAITTVLGMVPMVAPFLFPQWFGPVEGRAATRAPIGLVIIGGLTTSTFLTLLIIPTIYSLIDDASTFMLRILRSA